MLRIIAGHILGIIIPLYFFKNIPIEADGFWGKVLVYLLLLALLGFVDSQLFRSIKYGKLYFRGVIDESEGAAFTNSQFAYSVQSGFIIMVLLQHLAIAAS